MPFTQIRCHFIGRWFKSLGIRNWWSRWVNSSNFNRWKNMYFW